MVTYGYVSGNRYVTAKRPVRSPQLTCGYVWLRKVTRLRVGNCPKSGWAGGCYLSQSAIFYGLRRMACRSCRSCQSSLSPYWARGNFKMGAIGRVWGR
jgi:hypothetical protein